MLDLQNCRSNERFSTVPWCFLLSFITYSNHLQKGEKLQIGVDKLVGKV